MSVLRTQHLDAGVTGQVRNLRGARGGGASGTWSRFLLLFGLVSAGRTGLLAGVGQPEGLVSRRPGWRGVAGGGAERGAGGGAKRRWRRGANAHPWGGFCGLVAARPLHRADADQRWKYQIGKFQDLTSYHSTPGTS
jgi:hypothetical protein